MIAQKTNLNINEVKYITESLFNIIKQEIVNGNKVGFKSFGTFLQKKRSAKKAQLIQEKKTILISERHIPAFVPSKHFQVK
ncbi:HU family DNA-binding protein [Emticicia sp. SJ17W-69]|uniref:HU family DNA-binding protein n=1 Tax=Emticicia sp. SJ17W-69 TaxID=3421657 RepID=UPI003EB88CD3